MPDESEEWFTLEVRIKATEADAKLFASRLVPTLIEAGPFPGTVTIDGVSLVDGVSWMRPGGADA